MATTQLLALELALPNFSDTLSKIDSIDSLDLGRHSEQILMRDKTVAYQGVRIPMESENTVIVRTGECSGQFTLHVSQRL